MQGKLIIISAPSGTGKSTLINLLLNSEFGKDYSLSVSHTTRAMREGEVEGVSYYFIDKDRFKQMIADNDFIEYAVVYDNLYGTSKSAIKNKLEQGINVILDIDWQGARSVRESFPEAHSIFILPPSLESLRERLIGRNTDSLEIINSRMEKAENELSHKDEYEHQVVNQDLEQAFADLVTILKSL